MNRVASESLLIDIETHFKVSAGPGAGKTYWLIQHIKNVIKRSSRLQTSRKIACVTYTNIAVETIKSRLGSASDRLDVSTIHSFLYQHVLKPYAVFVPRDFQLNIEKMDGPDDLVLSNYSTLEELKSKTNQKRITDDSAIVDAISKSRWKFDGGKLVFKPDWPHKAQGYAIKNDTYFEYKKIAWSKGVIHHDDVLYLCYILIENNPFILDVLRAKFPYFFIDEFQDTSPIQSAILEKLGQSETVIGVIGDPAQSIYSFQGADLDKFINFSLPNMQTFTILENKRSTKSIVTILNRIRSDIKQECTRNAAGDKPTILIGDAIEALDKANALCNQGILHTLTFKNLTSNALKEKVNWGIENYDRLFQKLNFEDSNNDRRLCISSSIKAIEMASAGQFKDAIKEMSRALNNIKDKERQKAVALKYIMKLLSRYDELKGATLMHFYEIVKNELNLDLAGFKAGKAKAFYDGHSYRQLSLNVKIHDDKNLHRTIHKAKGDEFENVLLILTEEKRLDFLINSNLLNTSNEEHRVNYVAVSRAINKLFVSVPTLSLENENILSSDFCIERI